VSDGGTELSEHLVYATRGDCIWGPKRSCNYVNKHVCVCVCNSCSVCIEVAAYMPLVMYCIRYKILISHFI